VCPPRILARPEPPAAIRVDTNVRLLRCRLLRCLVFGLIVSCSPPGALPSPVPGSTDCGSFDAGHGGYDANGVDCFWRAYSAGTAARWVVRQQTVEGDPIPEAIQFVPGVGVTVTRDTSADKFAGSNGGRVWTYRCSVVARRPWATDPARYVFELSGCAGDGPSTAFP
jgi:hypothetical protein